MKANKVNLDIMVVHRTTVHDLVDQITMNHTDDAAFVMVASIDEAVCDWSFTERCFEHFRDLMEQREAEDEEDDA